MTITTDKATELVYAALKDIASRNKVNYPLNITKAQGLGRFGEILPIVLSDRVHVNIDTVRCATYITVYDIVVDVWDLHNNPNIAAEYRSSLAELKKEFAKSLRRDAKVTIEKAFDHTAYITANPLHSWLKNTT